MHIKNILLLTSLFSSIGIVNANAGDCPIGDCIVVVGERWTYGYGMWSVAGVSLAGGTGGAGGSNEYLMESATFESIDDSFVPVIISQSHEIDIDNNGSGDATFNENFIIYGVDNDGDGIADLWEEMTASGRAWPF